MDLNIQMKILIMKCFAILDNFLGFLHEILSIIERNKGLDRFFNFKEKYGFTDIKTCGNTGCITFLFEGEKYYYGPVSKKFKKKGTNKWFSWSNRNGEKKSSYKKVVRVKGKCVSCDKNIDESYVRCYNCYVAYNEAKLDLSMKNTNIYS